MEVIVTKNYHESANEVALLITKIVNQNPKASLGLATGSSAEGVYASLVQQYEAGKVNFSQTTTINLDEYHGVSPDSVVSYNYYMNQHLFQHVNVSSSHIFIADGSQDAEKEIKRLDKQLETQPTDVQLLGVGINGHIGFNEPHTFLREGFHLEDLNESTIQANSRFFDSFNDVPKQAITMGMGNILKSKRLVLIATGESKKEAIKELLCHDRISTDCPITFLKLHPHVTVVIDEMLAQAANYSK